MIRVAHIPDTNILEMEIDGAITAEEFDRVLADIEAAIKEHGKLKVLKRIGEIHMPPIPWSKFWDDLRFGMKHLSDFTHGAVVADQDWIRAWARVWNPLLKAEIKAFKLDELEQARAWLRDAE